MMADIISQVRDEIVILDCTFCPELLTFTVADDQDEREQRDIAVEGASWSETSNGDLICPYCEIDDPVEDEHRRADWNLAQWKDGE